MASKKDKLLELLNQGIRNVDVLAKKAETTLGYAKTIATEYERKMAQERLVVTDKLLREIVRVANWPEIPELTTVDCLHEDVSCRECSKTYWQKTKYGSRAPCIKEGEYSKEELIPRLKRMKNEKIRTALEDAYGIYLDEEKEPFGGSNPDSVLYVVMPEKLEKEITERFGKGRKDVAALRLKAFHWEKMYEFKDHLSK